MIDKLLLEQALPMPPNERLTFAELILASIDFEAEETRKSWIFEVNARMKAFREGRAKLLDIP